MGKKLFLLMCYTAFMMLCSSVIWGQQGVLLPEKNAQHVHDETCENECAHGTGGGWFNFTPYVTPRRFDNPGFNDLIKQSDNVGGSFGAGESSAVYTERVIWPAPRPLPQNVDTLWRTSILIGDDYSKNAVIKIYDNDGVVSGGLRDIRMFNYSGTAATTTTFVDCNTDTQLAYRAYGVRVPNNDPAICVPGDTSGLGNQGPLKCFWDLPNNPTNVSVVAVSTSVFPDPYPYRVFAPSINYSDTSVMERLAISSLTDIFNAIGTETGTTPGQLTTTYPPLWYIHPQTTGRYGTLPTGYGGSVLFPYLSNFNPITKMSTYTVIIHNHVTGYSPDGMFTFTSQVADTAYTSTRLNAVDDGKELLITIQDSYQDGTANYDDYIDRIKLDPNVNYIRPTTVLLSGTNELKEITIKDVQWYAAFYEGTIDTVEYEPFLAFGAGGCAHYSGWMSFIQDNAYYDTIEVATAPHTTQGTWPSGQYVDAAVRLLDYADVHVMGSVMDSTTELHSKNTHGDVNGFTDAMLVLPGANNSGNFRLKIDGDAIINHLQQDGDYDPSLPTSDPLIDGYLYSAHISPINPLGGAGPGELFPIVQTPVYLGSGISPTLWPFEVEGLKYDIYVHPREQNPPTLTHQIPPGDDTKWMPYQSTRASVYGVNGLFDPWESDIYTQSAFLNDTTSIIEIGSITNNQNKFHIYSSGMLKNYRAGDVYSNLLEIGHLGEKTAPEFILSNDSMPLYIIYDGNGSGDDQDLDCGGIVFNYPGVDSINQAIANATGGGDLHIQSLGFIKFMDNDPTPLPITLDFTLKKDNEVKILSDQSFIHIQNALNFMNADSAHLTIWANGADIENRGITYDNCETGAVEIDGAVNIEYAGGYDKGKGLILIRSAFDDVLLGNDFSFTNTRATLESGELMVQAGQDIRIEGTTDLFQDGARSILFEARKTIALGVFNATMGTTMKNGDLTLKAGYGRDNLNNLYFLPTADVSDLSLYPYWNPSDGCVEPGYENRDPGGRHEFSGGDIWFKGDVNINLSPKIADSVDVYIRAFNSIYVDGDYQHYLFSNSRFNSGLYVDSTLTYAETGNYEAIGNGTVEFNFSDNDSVYFLLQAGNTLGNPCGPTGGPTACDYSILPITSSWHGNVLFGDNKTFTITHHGVGPTLISASRDIENQEGALVTFTYDNPALSDGDSVKVTAGRHIETHAPYLFDFYTAGPTITNNITMQAGHQQAGCDYLLCKAPEYATNLAYNYVQSYAVDPDSLNEFAAGGTGNGSILLFNSAQFDYHGKGTILMTAKNGNIESDPYLHGSYPGGAPIIFNTDGSEGIVRMEAIDIKLHDILQYQGSTAIDLKNGRFYMAAFDSILTRNISYTNLTDTGSVFITTDKFKYTSPTVCGESDYTTDQRGIHQGHIVLGYASDCGVANKSDVILFDFSSNPNTEGANLFIKAGYEGYNRNPITGINTSLLANRPADKGKGYGGNITFDFMKINMALGDGNKSGYTEISTPNGNIWGKDSIQYHGILGNLRIDAGLGSLEDTVHAVRWSGFSNRRGASDQNMLNTRVPFCCDPGGEWRTGNIMLKGGSVDFTNDVTGGVPGNGNVFFRTREGFIDIYDRFNATNMTGHLLIYAGITPATQQLNEWGDVSQRDFQYTPVVNSGSVFFGADDNIMLNYGYSNGMQPSYYYYAPNNLGYYDGAAAGLIAGPSGNPFYSSEFPNTFQECYSIFNVNVNGYLWYKNDAYTPRRSSHLLYRGCEGILSAGQNNLNCSPLTGECFTVDNGARPLTFNFNKTDAGADILSGGLAIVASNYIDMFTKFTYEGGKGLGLHSVPEMTTLKGEKVEGYGLYIKSLFNGANPEKRRNTCENCQDADDYNWMEWPGITFHDDARFHTQGQRSLIEAPIIEFFGHAEFDAETNKTLSTKLTVKADSLIFHDSAIFAGPLVEMVSFTTDPAVRNASKESIMRYGVVNDDVGFENYMGYGKAIVMPDRGTPILEFGYQRCYEPPYAPTAAPNRYSRAGGENTPMVGGDVIVAFKYGFALPIYNTVVANHARISFMDDLHDGVRGGEFVDTYIRTDLLRIRNKVEFYTDPDRSAYRLGTLRMTSNEQMPSVAATGIYPHHLHLEPGSELSIPDEDSLVVISTTTVGGYGEIHENVHVLANGIIAPGYASLMESDCQTGFPQGRLSVHNLYMEKDAVMRVSLRYDPSYCQYNPDTKVYDLNCTRMDTLFVQDSIFFFGRISLHVLIEDKFIEPGCYLFMEYNETEQSVEYVNNLVLMTTRHGDLHLTLDKSERGRVYLCVTEFETPIIQRYVLIHEVDGVKTNPIAEIYHYIPGHQDFTFTATYANKTPLEVLATGYYTQRTTKLPATYLLDGTYEYRIRQVVEPYDVYFGGIDPDSDVVSNEGILGKRVWAYRNTLFINVDKDDVVSIYNVTGILSQKLEIPAGLQKLTLDKGVYMVTLKNGTVHKIIIN